MEEYRHKYSPRPNDIVRFTVEKREMTGIIESAHAISMYPPYDGPKANPVRTGFFFVICEDGERRSVHLKNLLKDTAAMKERDEANK